MVEEVIMGVVPAGVRHPPETRVLGTDHNAAYALLLRWWGLLDAEPAVDTSSFWEALVDDGVVVDIPDLHAAGRDAVADAVAILRSTGVRSHHLAFDALSVSWIETDLYRLDAQFVEQKREHGAEVVSRRSSYRALLRKRSDGLLVFHRIEGAVLRAEPAGPFEATYALNRAKATMVQFQTHTDLLTGDAGPMRELLMPDLELNGLVNSKADRTQSGDAPFTDVRSLRETISTSERKQDNVIRTFEEFSAWFSSCTALFRPDGFHELELFELTELPARRYQVVAQFHWRATTINGASIDLHTPLTWILVDTGEKYMRIEKLLPFG